jgi:hypothetical protein
MAYLPNLFRFSPRHVSIPARRTWTANVLKKLE